MSDWLDANGSALIAIVMGAHLFVTLFAAAFAARKSGLHPAPWVILALLWWVALEKATVTETIDHCFRGLG